jgi:hypothetical protein
MTSEQKPREFFIEVWDESEGSPMIVQRPVSYKNFRPIDKAEVIHVVEILALEQAQARIEELEAEIEMLEEAPSKFDTKLANNLVEAKLVIKNAKLKEQLSDAVKALEFYADNENWYSSGRHDFLNISFSDTYRNGYDGATGGKLAVETLAKLRGE